MQFGCAINCSSSGSFHQNMTWIANRFQSDILQYYLLFSLAAFWDQLDFEIGREKHPSLKGIFCIADKIFRNNEPPLVHVAFNSRTKLTCQSRISWREAFGPHRLYCYLRMRRACLQVNAFPSSKALQRWVVGSRLWNWSNDLLIVLMIPRIAFFSIWFDAELANIYNPPSLLYDLICISFKMMSPKTWFVSR